MNRYAEIGIKSLMIAGANFYGFDNPEGGKE
jgi:hypothetical protein